MKTTQIYTQLVILLALCWIKRENITPDQCTLYKHLCWSIIRHQAGNNGISYTQWMDLFQSLVKHLCKTIFKKRMSSWFWFRDTAVSVFLWKVTKSLEIFWCCLRFKLYFKILKRTNSKVICDTLEFCEWIKIDDVI